MEQPFLDPPVKVRVQTVIPADTRRVDGDSDRLSMRQCTGTNKNHTRCMRPPTPGGNVCVLHGGASPLAKQAAQRMLLSLVEPAVHTLFEALEANDIYDKPAWGVRVSAAKALLDRAGFGPQARISLEKPTEDFSQYSNEELARTLQQLASSAIDLLPSSTDPSVHE